MTKLLLDRQTNLLGSQRLPDRAEVDFGNSRHDHHHRVTVRDHHHGLRDQPAGDMFNLRQFLGRVAGRVLVNGVRHPFPVQVSLKKFQAGNPMSQLEQHPPHLPSPFRIVPTDSKRHRAGIRF